MNAVAKQTAPDLSYSPPRISFETRCAAVETAKAQIKARALRDDLARQARRAPLEGRTLDTAPSAELSSEERVARMARTSSAFEGL